MKTAGTMFLASLLHGGNSAKNLILGQIDHLFRDFEVPAYEWVKNFSKTYGALPTEPTFEDALKIELPTAPEPPTYYLDRLRSRYTHDNLLEGLAKSQSILGDSHDEKAALDAIAQTVMKLIAERNSGLVLDFRQAYDLVMQAYYAKKSQMDEGIEFGWPTLDKMTGGLTNGDVVSICGRPAAGKSWLVCYNAYHAWSKQNKVPLIVSMEMNMLVVTQRLSAIHTKKNFSQIKDGALSSVGEKQVSDRLATLSGAEVPLWVLDGNLSSSVEDIYAIAQQLKPDVIYIDGAYLLTHPKEKNRFIRVAENTSLIKKELASLCPVECSWQFNREASKKKKSDDVGVEDIGYSDAIAQISSVIIGLFQEESIETVQGRVVHVMKGRNGETGKFNTRWAFDVMDFSEYEDIPIEEVQY